MKQTHEISPTQTASERPKSEANPSLDIAFAFIRANLYFKYANRKYL